MEDAGLLNLKSVQINIHHINGRVPGVNGRAAQVTTLPKPSSLLVLLNIHKPVDLQRTKISHTNVARYLLALKAAT